MKYLRHYGEYSRRCSLFTFPSSGFHQKVQYFVSEFQYIFHSFGFLRKIRYENNGILTTFFLWSAEEIKPLGTRNTCGTEKNAGSGITLGKTVGEKTLDLFGRYRFCQAGVFNQSWLRMSWYWNGKPGYTWIRVGWRQPFPCTGQV